MSELLGSHMMDAILRTDEFGRNLFLSVLLSMAWSIARAAYMALLLFVCSIALVMAVELKGNRIIRTMVQVVIDALESVPIYVWVLAGVSWAPQHRNTTTTLIFVLAGLPLLYNTLSAIVAQIMKKPYYQAAIALGASDWHLVRCHLLPNVIPHAIPLVLYVSGAAMAIYGGVGVFGFVNRSELDLGVFLLRGKEQAGFDLTILTVTVAAYLVIFLVLQYLIKVFNRVPSVAGSKR